MEVFEIEDPPLETEARDYSFLDGLRGIGALAVYLNHQQLYYRRMK